jgi:hypothetical protein
MIALHYARLERWSQVRSSLKRALEMPPVGGRIANAVLALVICTACSPSLSSPGASDAPSLTSEVLGCSYDPATGEYIVRVELSGTENGYDVVTSTSSSAYVNAVPAFEDPAYRAAGVTARLPKAPGDPIRFAIRADRAPTSLTMESPPIALHDPVHLQADDAQALRSQTFEAGPVTATIAHVLMNELGLTFRTELSPVQLAGGLSVFGLEDPSASIGKTMLEDRLQNVTYVDGVWTQAVWLVPPNSTHLATKGEPPVTLRAYGVTLRYPGQVSMDLEGRCSS